MDANEALELERVTAAARDALTDEMVGRRRPRRPTRSI